MLEYIPIIAIFIGGYITVSVTLKKNSSSIILDKERDKVIKSFIIAALHIALVVVLFYLEHTYDGYHKILNRDNFDYFCFVLILIFLINRYFCFKKKDFVMSVLDVFIFIIYFGTVFLESNITIFLSIPVFIIMVTMYFIAKYKIKEKKMLINLNKNQDTFVIVYLVNLLVIVCISIIMGSYVNLFGESPTVTSGMNIFYFILILVDVINWIVKANRIRDKFGFYLKLDNDNCLYVINCEKSGILISKKAYEYDKFVYIDEISKPIYFNKDEVIKSTVIWKKLKYSDFVKLSNLNRE